MTTLLCLTTQFGVQLDRTLQYFSYLSGIVKLLRNNSQNEIRFTFIYGHTHYLGSKVGKFPVLSIYTTPTKFTPGLYSDHVYQNQFTKVRFLNWSFKESNPGPRRHRQHCKTLGLQSRQKLWNIYFKHNIRHPVFTSELTYMLYAELYLYLSRSSGNSR